MFKRIAIVATAAFVLSGCAATQVAISKRDLDVQTKMSDTVFLDPVGADKRTIFLQIRNTSDKPDLSVNEEIAAALQAKGYTLMQDPDAAHYILQANILQVGKSAPTATEAAISQGYGISAAGGLVLGAGAGYAGGASGRGIAAAGLIGALAPMIALLGTVWGMVKSFMEIAASTTSPKPAKLAEGISTALITTLIGLVIAIVAVAVFAFFKNRLQSLNAAVDDEAMKVMSRFSKRSSQATPSATA